MIMSFIMRIIEAGASQNLPLVSQSQRE
jgi:hypothetical protein